MKKRTIKKVRRGLDLTGVSSCDVEVRFEMIDGRTCSPPREYEVGDKFIMDFLDTNCLSCLGKVTEIYYDEDGKPQEYEVEFTGKVYCSTD